MQRLRRILLATAVALGLCLPAAGVTVRVENATGNVTARVVAAPNVRIHRSSPARELRQDDTVITQQPGLIIVEARSGDGARIDLELDLPYGCEFHVRTTSGAISVTGLLYRAELITDTGDIKLAAPWAATRLRVSSNEEPKEFSAPKGVKFLREKTGGKGEPEQWLLTDKLPGLKITYGRVRIQANSPGRLVLEDIPIPEDSPVKLPWQAPPIVNSLIAARKRSKPSKPGRHSPLPAETTKATTVDEGIPHFTAEVRMVNLTAAVFDRHGHAVTDLKPEDFEVFEDGVPQQVTFAGSEEVPFNLALLLDLSGSTRRDRPAMKEAAKRFAGITRPHDRVAAYALASNMFQVISPLTEDRQRLQNLIEALPQVSGGTPLYDTIVLSYAQEFRQRPAERNALIVISDGVDNRVRGTGAASEVSFKKLRQAAESMNVLIYPVFLVTFTKVPPPEWSRRARLQMQALADATGGRLFPAQSIRDLDPVYPLVADELRSVYTVAYYPRNQDFDGAWRQVQVRVKRPGARARTRKGYFAR